MSKISCNFVVNICNKDFKVKSLKNYVTMKSITEKMYEGLKPLYKNLMEHCGAFCDDYTKTTGVNIVSFAAQWGQFYPQEEKEGILFVGRATRGWSNDDRNVDNLFDHPKDRIFNREDQMVWAKDYQSPFWRVLRGVANHFYGENGVENVAWTNVSKLAPDSDNGNPAGKLYDIQQEDDYAIFSKEVEILSPKVIVFFTGEGWGDDYLCTINNYEEPQVLSEYEWASYKTKVYQVDDRLVIMSEHPQTRPEQEHIDCLVNIISKYMK